MVSKFSVFIRISIHAPTRGATKLCEMLSSYLKFQSTLLQEERLYLFCTCSKRLLFQSTLLQEERPDICVKTSLSSEFQSTLLQEERPYPKIFTVRKSQFQSTLLQEERRDDATPHCRFKNFNPRSYKRSD